MAKASEIIKQAQKWLGRKESDGSFKEIINVYNGHSPLARGYAVKYTDEWCATFVSAVAIMCNATDIIPTECGCQKMIELFKKLGVWVENENRTPSVGDVIFYDWQDDGKGDNQGYADHVGYVEKVSGSTITVIEGNYDSEVKRRTLAVNGKYIRGYAVPKYEKEAVAAPKPSTTVSTSTLKAGQAVYLSNTAVYGNASTASVSSRKTGTFYLWDVNVVSGRVKITNRADRVGKAGQVTGWMNVADITGYKPATTTTNVSIYYPKYTGNETSLDAILKAVGVPSAYIKDKKNETYEVRKPLAQANGISNYAGTYMQNKQLITLAKQGKLKKV